MKRKVGKETEGGVCVCEFVCVYVCVCVMMHACLTCVFVCIQRLFDKTEKGEECVCSVYAYVASMPMWRPCVTSVTRTNKQEH